MGFTTPVKVNDAVLPKTRKWHYIGARAEWARLRGTKIGFYFSPLPVIESLRVDIKLNTSQTPLNHASLEYRVHLGFYERAETIERLE